MFTGITEETGTVKEATSNHLLIEARKVLEGIEVSDSIAVNGACLTITSLNNSTFTVAIMPETLRHTNLGGLHYGDQVNLERALIAGGRLGGHLVLGHIDDTGEVMTVIPEEAAHIMRISAPARLMSYIVTKGFIAVDGVSLTITDLDDFSFTVSLVAYTMEHTILGNRRPGDRVNLEADIIAKYIERLKERKSRGLTTDFLEKYGFAGKEA
jgi:riboflavin synthase